MIAGLPSPGTSEVYVVENGKAKITQSNKSPCFPEEPIDEELLIELYNRCAVKINVPSKFKLVEKALMLCNCVPPNCRHFSHFEEGSQAWIVDNALSTSVKFLLDRKFKIRVFLDTEDQVGVAVLCQNIVNSSTCSVYIKSYFSN